MTINMNSTANAIKKAGAAKVRILPMAGQNVLEGDYQIEIKEEDNWVVLVTGLKKVIAEQIVGQALNRTICG